MGNGCSVPVVVYRPQEIGPHTKVTPVLQIWQWILPVHYQGSIDSTIEFQYHLSRADDFMSDMLQLAKLSKINGTSIGLVDLCEDTYPSEGELPTHS